MISHKNMIKLKDGYIPKLYPYNILNKTQLDKLGLDYETNVTHIIWY